MLSGLGACVLGWYALSRVREVGGESQILADRAAQVSASGVDPLAIRDVAVLHYDALEEMAGARSFSLALLNSEGDGVVVTSINGRTESRTYAKPVVGGGSDVLLSPEENRVIRSARLGECVGAAKATGGAGSGPRRSSERTGGVGGEEDASDPGPAQTAAEPTPTAAAGRARAAEEDGGGGMVSVVRGTQSAVGGAEGTTRSPR